jgi:hypothetical protein
MLGYEQRKDKVAISLQVRCNRKSLLCLNLCCRREWQEYSDLVTVKVAIDQPQDLRRNPDGEVLDSDRPKCQDRGGQDGGSTSHYDPSVDHGTIQCSRCLAGAVGDSVGSDCRLDEGAEQAPGHLIGQANLIVCEFCSRRHHAATGKKYAGMWLEVRWLKRYRGVISDSRL